MRTLLLYRGDTLDFFQYALSYCIAALMPLCVVALACDCNPKYCTQNHCHSSIISFSYCLGADVSRKRRRSVIDEAQVALPLRDGWRRETRIKHVTRRGIVGDVTYVTPCDKRIKCYADLDRVSLRLLLNLQVVNLDVLWFMSKRHLFVFAAFSDSDLQLFDA